MPREKRRNLNSEDAWKGWKRRSWNKNTCLGKNLARRYPKSQSTDAAVPGNFKDKEVLAKGRTYLTTCGVEERKRGEKKGKEREVGGLQIAGGRQLHVHQVASSGIKTNLWRFRSLQ